MLLKILIATFCLQFDSQQLMSQSLTPGSFGVCAAAASVVCAFLHHPWTTALANRWAGFNLPETQP